LARLLAGALGLDSTTVKPVSTVIGPSSLELHKRASSSLPRGCIALSALLCRRRESKERLWPWGFEPGSPIFAGASSLEELDSHSPSALAFAAFPCEVKDSLALSCLWLLADSWFLKAHAGLTKPSGEELDLPVPISVTTSEVLSRDRIFAYPQDVGALLSESRGPITILKLVGCVVSARSVAAMWFSSAASPTFC